MPAPLAPHVGKVARRGGVFFRFRGGRGDKSPPGGVFLFNFGSFFSIRGFSTCFLWPHMSATG